jgi:hypothetical protein
MNTTFRTMLCSTLIAGIISSAHAAQSVPAALPAQSNASQSSAQNSSNNVTVTFGYDGPSAKQVVTAVTATALVAAASYIAYRIYTNSTTDQTIEGKIATAYNTLAEISKDTFIANTPETENDSDLTLQATKRFTESQFPLILAQNYLVAQAGQLTTADRCLTEARSAIKNSLENEKTTEQEKDRLNKLDDTCRQIKKHITAYTALIDKKLTAIFDLDGYEVQLALYAQADAVHRNEGLEGLKIFSHYVFVAIGISAVVKAINSLGFHLLAAAVAHANPNMFNNASVAPTSSSSSSSAASAVAASSH